MPPQNKLPRYPQGSLECLGIVCDIMEYHKKINSLGTRNVWNALEWRVIMYKNQLPRHPQGSLECLGIAWNIEEYHIKINSLGTHKGLWNALE